MPDTGPPTILFEVFWTQQRRKLLIDAALAGTELPAEDYPFYVLIGAEGPWTPTGLAERLMMPLSTVLFRFRRLERRGHAERVRNPDDGRSFLMRLTPEGTTCSTRRDPRSARAPKRWRRGSARSRSTLCGRASNPSGRPSRRSS